MRPTLLVDINLSPEWIPVLQKHGWQAVHWSDIGDPRASDRDTMDWAATHQYVVFTHDLDFGTMLALTHEAGPSVLQVRAENILPDYLEGSVICALNQHESDLSSGALVVVDESRSRFECCRYETAHSRDPPDAGRRPGGRVAQRTGRPAKREFGAGSLGGLRRSRPTPGPATMKSRLRTQVGRFSAGRLIWRSNARRR